MGAYNGNRIYAYPWSSNGEGGDGEDKAEVEVVRLLMDYGGSMEMVKEEFLIVIHAHDSKIRALLTVDKPELFVSDSIRCPITPNLTLPRKPKGGSSSLILLKILV